MGIIVTISLVTALSKCLTDTGSIELIMAPGAKIMKTPSIAFWVVGLTMMVISYFLWPSPSVALVGAVLLPIAVKTGLAPIAVAMAMNIFGHGISLSSDFIIQGAPKITAQAAGIPISDVTFSGLPLYITMAVVTVAAAFFIVTRDRKKAAAALQSGGNTVEAAQTAKHYTKTAKFIAILTPVAFVADIIAMLVLKLTGDDATAMVAGTAIILLCIASVLSFKSNSFDKITDYVRDGFIFGIKIFAPVIVIGGFFFLGGDNIGDILGGSFTGHSGILTDWALWLSGHIALSKYPVILIQIAVAILTGLDGSGFSGLPLVGSLAATFGTAASLNVGTLAALGQLVTIWVGGGVLIPWAVIPVAAICGVEPVELARKNFLPVILGFVATFIIACLIL
jgi:hypothetical protein